MRFQPFWAKSALVSAHALRSRYFPVRYAPHSCSYLEMASGKFLDGTVSAMVFILALQIKTGSSVLGASQIFIDSVSVTNDPVGPYDFTFNRHPLEMGSAADGAALDWLAAPPSPGP